MSSFFNIPERLLKTAEEAERLCVESFNEIEKTARFNGEKVLNAFIKNKVGSMHLTGTTGYGYDDAGRDRLDAVFASVLGTEDALVRHNFVNGTHAISTALFGVLRPGDVLYSVTGAPYDTLLETVNGTSGGSLREFGIEYIQSDFKDNGTIDYGSVKTNAEKCKVAYIQRSRGYALRSSLTADEINEIVDLIKSVNPAAVVLVDNCYGELCEVYEPKADLLAGSLIKNLGGGIAETGGYIAGRADLVEMCANRLTAVGAGREVGCSLNQNRGMYLGLFRAPETVAAALKTSVFASALLELLGYRVFPRYTEKRTDLITAALLGGKEKLVSFCKGIQAGSPVDSYVSPEPWAMPGYKDEVIMAAGAFTMGASIELSADAPLREPYAVFIQGGLSYTAGRIGILKAVSEILV